MRTLGIAAALLIGAAGLSAATVSDAEVRKWLEEVDAVRNAFPEAIISARAVHEIAGKVHGSADFDVYRKGPERALLVFRGGKNSGRKMLTSGEKMWLIVPGARNAVPVSANQRLLGGASFGDVARVRFADDYTARLRGEEMLDGRPAYVLDLTARAPGAPYPKLTLWLDREKRLPRQVLFYLPSGKPIRQVKFTKILPMRGKTVVTEMEIRELLGRDSNAVTRLQYRDYRPAKIDDAIFTPEGARGL
ncbi:MAG: outer membrane lipoprotein-sorting protein [Thermoanaerobaculia bacterium]|nr:outer membrane lipoprotein-sorting protein [Thermoanaerobaculia bacterium]